jgi:hypothetical protein
MQQKLLGTEHPSVATCENNLAAVLRDEGQLAEAATLIRAALGVRQKLLGEQHPSVADSRRDLTNVLALQSRSGSGH